MGHPQYQITNGTIYLSNSDITQLSVDKRAQAGLFLAFQHPYEIPGVTVLSFLKEAYHACTKTIISMKDFQELLYSKMALLEMDKAFAHRALNHGFSGGEKKRLEILQMLVLKPKVAILDEIDSGLDVDAIKIVAQGLQIAREENPDLGILIITHYPRLLSYIQPDFVHIMHKGLIVERGSAALAFAIEERGYDARHP
jgi:Fe-S cluster assembly ATP-binding protein